MGIVLFLMLFPMVVAPALHWLCRNEPGNEGKMVAVVRGEDGQRALQAMHSHPLGENARCIGYVTEGAGVALRTRLGGLRAVDELYGEGLPRIC